MFVGLLSSLTNGSRFLLVAILALCDLCANFNLLLSLLFLLCWR